ncbi:MAG: LytTR family transcriptional regulator DNA-binding domain-containing protein [Bacillus sp. (in: Bacteria)]|nr:LytTR family transcriptional regulator DNA-binding domain-containing protein [Bacillus sp. (in: firmicutes)]
MEIGREIYEKSRLTKIIYVTHFTEYCMDAVNAAHAFAFLKKPVSEKELEKQLLAFLQSDWKKEVRMVFRNVAHKENGIMVKKSSITLLLNTVLYFEYIKSRKKVRIVTRDVIYEYPDTITSLAVRMSIYAFEVSCRGILVNLQNVAKIKGYEVILKNGMTVPLSQKRVAQFKKRLNEYIMNL